MQDIFHWIRATVAARVNRRFVRINNKRLVARVILLPEREVFLNTTAIQTAVNPMVAQPKLKVRVFAVFFNGADDTHYRADGNTVNGLFFNLCRALCCHDLLQIVNVESAW